MRCKCATVWVDRGMSGMYSCDENACIDCRNSYNPCIVTDVVFDGIDIGRNAWLRKMLITDSKECASYVDANHADFSEGVALMFPDLTLPDFVYSKDAYVGEPITGGKRYFTPELEVIEWSDSYRIVYRFNENYVASYLGVATSCPPDRVCAVGIGLLYCYEAPYSVTIRTDKTIPELKQMLSSKNVKCGYAWREILDVTKSPPDIFYAIEIITNTRSDLQKVLDALNELGLSNQIIEIND